MTLALMYRKYCEESKEHPVSFPTYRAIFLSEFNLKFKKLKKDTCNTCDTYQSKIQNALTSEEKEKHREDHDNHIKYAEGARDLMKTDIKKAKNPKEKIECLTFDLEKTLPLPRLATGILFYKRQIWLYNLGVYSGSTNKGHFYVWMENEAGRGAQEIGSCLIKHIKDNIPNDITELVLWSDSCGGQNRNIKMTLMLKAVLQSHTSLEKIRMRFLVSGHSFLPNDSHFSDVECALKHQQRLYLPDDYIKIMKECRTKNKFKVSRMVSTEFYGTAELEKQIVNRKVDAENKKISWLRTREILLEKEKPFSIFLKTNFEDSKYAEIDIRKKQVGRPAIFKDLLVPLWLKGKQISNPKLADIKSVMHLIPNDCKQFYENIAGTDIVDDVDGFSGTPDFEVEPLTN